MLHANNIYTFDSSLVEDSNGFKIVKIPESVNGVSDIGTDNDRTVLLLSDSVTTVDSRGGSIIVCIDEAHRNIVEENSAGMSPGNIYLTQNEYDRFLESNTENVWKFVRDECDVFKRNENGEIVGVRDSVHYAANHFFGDTVITLPEGSKVDVYRFYMDVVTTDINAIVDGDKTYNVSKYQDCNIVDWAKSRDDCPVFVENGVAVGIKPYCREQEFIVLPETVNSFNNKFLEDFKGHTLVIENPDFDFYVNSTFFNPKLAEDISVITNDGPQDLISLLRQNNHCVDVVSLESDSEPRLVATRLHRLYVNDESLTLPEGVSCVEGPIFQRNENLKTIYLPCSFDSLSKDLLAPNLETIVINEGNPGLSLDNFHLQEMNRPLTIVCSDEVRDVLRYQIDNYNEASAMSSERGYSLGNNITFMNHAEYEASKETNIDPLKAALEEDEKAIKDDKDVSFGPVLDN